MPTPKLTTRGFMWATQTFLTDKKAHHLFDDKAVLGEHGIGMHRDAVFIGLDTAAAIYQIDNNTLDRTELEEPATNIYGFCMMRDGSEQQIQGRQSAQFGFNLSDFKQRLQVSQVAGRVILLQDPLAARLPMTYGVLCGIVRRDARIGGLLLVQGTCNVLSGL